MKLPELLPGDHLVYNTQDFFGLVTRIKTWSYATHIEVYIGNGKSVASRNGIGVNVYPLRLTELAYVLRPNVAIFDIDRGMRWFEHHAKGQGYDWLGLLCFTLAVKQGAPHKMFCSEFARRFDRECQIASFNPNWDADKTAPGDFLKSPAFTWIYTNVKE